MATVAEQLKCARESLHLSIYQVAEATKIKTDHVRALESGNYNLFSAAVYIRGFVRTYSTLLKLDVPSVMAILDAELAQTEKFREPPSLPQHSPGWLDFWTLQFSKVNWQLVLPIFLLAIFVALGLWGLRAWQNHKRQDPLANLGPGLYQAPTNTVSPTLPLPTNSASHP